MRLEIALSLQSTLRGFRMPHDTFEEFLQQRKARQNQNVFEVYESTFGERPPAELLQLYGKYLKLDKLKLFLSWRIADNDPVEDWDEIAVGAVIFF